MKKIIISKLFLYRYRFVIGYIVLGLVFIALLVLLPFRYFSPVIAELTRAVVLVFNSIVYFKMYDFFYSLPANNNSDKAKDKDLPDQGEILLAANTVFYLYSYQ